ncbi:hypothetical protein [Mesomycoplasma hyopneumoniae]|uniref:hypothetical protein n=1 Tax=Mesomycoplasma hyopneumoniae TaxID=2099 RepID=UPI001F4DCC25|nr:hypothetical protein [Mesomycoplasma hyopneumoniae]
MENKAFFYDSSDFLEQIEIVYIGASSTNNLDFYTKIEPVELNLAHPEEQEKLIFYLKQQNFVKINIDENCIVGWAKKFFSENPGKNKQDFIGDNTGLTRVLGEIRTPNLFKNYINPYQKDSNIRFEYLMDQLNSKIQQKNLGAFYTPKPYVLKAYELLRKAIAEIPAGNDYIILDRCAGTGNLEKWLTNEELSHTIISTYEYYEYKVLLEKLGDKVRHIIPPVEDRNTFLQGLVSGANALSFEYINNKIIKEYVDNPKCSIIIFENPPYVEPTAIEQQKLKTAKESRESWKNNYVVQEAKKISHLKGAEFNELANYFIWSAFEYYIRKKGDALIVFSPVKYFKWQNVANYKIGGGFGFNRKHFHASPGFVSLIWWKYEKAEFNEVDLEVFDIDQEKNEISFIKTVKIKKTKKMFSQTIYKWKSENPERVAPEKGLSCEYNGRFSTKTGKSLYGPPQNLDNDHFIAYLRGDAFTLGPATVALVRAKTYNEHGFWLHKNNFLVGLIAFSAGIFKIMDGRWENTYLVKSGDGFSRFLQDLKSKKRYKLERFLLSNLFFVSLSLTNHIRSLAHPDLNNSTIYLNELCLDDLNQKETLALKSLRNYDFDDQEKELLEIWKIILKQAAQTKNYEKHFKYGLYQIDEELNTKTLIPNRKSNKYIYDYPELNGNIETLKVKLKKYYFDKIVPILFEYEFLK